MYIDDPRLEIFLLNIAPYRYVYYYDTCMMCSIGANRFVLFFFWWGWGVEPGCISVVLILLYHILIILYRSKVDQCSQVIECVRENLKNV